MRREDEPRARAAADRRRTTSALQHERDGGDDLDDRIANADRVPARAAAAAEHEVAQHGNVVVPANRRPARRAPRAGRDDRLARRQPPDADVEKAADRPARRRQRAAAGSASSSRRAPAAAAPELDCRRQRDAVRRRVVDERRAGRVERARPAAGRRGSRSSQLAGIAPGRRRDTARSSACSSSIASSASSCASAALGRRRMYARSASSSSVEHLPRAVRGRRPAPASSRRAAAIHSGAPGMAAARSNHSAACR